MNNKQNGNELERLFANTLAKKEYWVHRMQDNANGQPFDIIAVSDDMAAAYECKDCKNDIFEFNRIEENQRLAYNAWVDGYNSEFFIVIRFNSLPNKVFLIGMNAIIDMEECGKKRITLEEAIFYDSNKNYRGEFWQLG